ncbi:hypothetical protein E2C01_096807 [Portunus trituberculatus]|uniref:Uncharacterized protein n=1 Tax=Portunus trituberculatus TaxID=210409 RepID=A0A5B7K425_PORTR|nr:hypothetical protein [Portunus trituberculatus]
MAPQSSSSQAQVLGLLCSSGCVGCIGRSVGIEWEVQGEARELRVGLTGRRFGNVDGETRRKEGNERMVEIERERIT